MYIPKCAKNLGLALGLAGAVSAGCSDEPVHELNKDWIMQDYTKDPNVLDSNKEWFYVFEECPREGGPCTTYRFQGRKEAVDSAVIRMKKGERYTFTLGDLDSINEAR